MLLTWAFILFASVVTLQCSRLASWARKTYLLLNAAVVLSHLRSVISLPGYCKRDVDAAIWKKQQHIVRALCRKRLMEECTEICSDWTKEAYESACDVAIAALKAKARYCDQCRVYKAPNTYHCHRCAACVQGRDHHCPWINNCVGKSNMRKFLTFLHLVVLDCGITVFLLLVNLFSTSTSSDSIVFDSSLPIDPQVSNLAAMLALSISAGNLLFASGVLIMSYWKIFRNQATSARGLRRHSGKA